MNVIPKQSIFCANIPKKPDELLLDGKTEPTLLELKAMLDLSNINKNSDRLPTEMFLYYERLRSQIVGGITSYSYHSNDKAFLLNSGSQLHFFKVILKFYNIFYFK